MAGPHSFLLVLVATLMCTASLSLSPASAAKCHPQDKKTLLAMKRFWNNPAILASWTPSTDCCSWNGVYCDVVTHSVTGLEISGSTDITAVPPTVGDLAQLQYLSMYKLPRLTGPIPTVLSKIRNLIYLRLDSNNFTGPIPSFIAQIPQLWYLNLAHNRLTGSIPGAIAGLYRLSYLALDGNQLTGPIPAEFGKFQGSFLLLSHNNLSGPLPPSLGAVNFSEFNVSGNRLSGDATFLFGKNKESLNYIDLSWNMFEFDLGQVVFPTVPELHTINLNHNRIYGKIPKQIADLYYLRTLDLSYNRLCGEIPTGGKLGLFKAEVYVQNQCLCGKPLPPC